MIKHYCDKCGHRIDDPKKLKRFILETHKPHLTVDCEFCESCFKDVFPDVVEQMETKQIELDQKKEARPKMREQERTKANEN